MIEPPSPLAKKVMLACIILLGAFFRLQLIDALPPGDDFDPAYYGLDALRILDGERPVYLETNYGREAMFSYVVAGAFLVVGAGTLGIHLATALIGILTIPALYLIANEWFRLGREGAGRRWGGLLAALILALSFWHLVWSRYGVRAILIPFFFSLTTFFLLRGYRRERATDFVAAGILLGLGLYTYQLAQLLPFLVAAFFLFELWAGRGFKKRQWAYLLILFAAAVFVALPLAVFAYEHPGVYNQRVGGVLLVGESTPIAEQLPALLERAKAVPLMFLYEGDTSWTINLPGRPAFNPFLAFFLVVGVLISLWRWRQPRTLFLLTWLAIMVAPAVLADKAPLSKRALGALPAAILLITLGVLWPLDHWTGQRKMKPWTRILTIGCIGAGLVFTAYSTYRDYFLRWGAEAGLYEVFDVGVKAIGQRIAELPADEVVYLSPTWGEHAVLKLHAQGREGIRAYNGRHCLIFPERTEEATTFIIVPGDDKHSLPLLLSTFPEGQSSEEGLMPDGGHYFTVYQIPANAEAEFRPQVAMAGNWDNQIELLGYDLEEKSYLPGDTVAVTLYQRAPATMSRNHTMFVHLWGAEDPANGIRIYGQEDREPCFQSYPTSYWQPGEIMRDTFTFSIAQDTPPGTYELATGVYTWPEIERLPLLQADGASRDNAVILGQLVVGPSS